MDQPKTSSVLETLIPSSLASCGSYRSSPPRSARSSALCLLRSHLLHLKPILGEGIDLSSSRFWEDPCPQLPTGPLVGCAYRPRPGVRVQRPEALQRVPVRRAHCPQILWHRSRGRPVSDPLPDGDTPSLTDTGSLFIFSSYSLDTLQTSAVILRPLHKGQNPSPKGPVGDARSTTGRQSPRRVSAANETA